MIEVEVIAAYAPAAPVFSAGAAALAAVGIWGGLIAMIITKGKSTSKKSSKQTGPIKSAILALLLVLFPQTWAVRA